MIWIKLLVSAAVVGFGVFLGWAAAGKYRARAQWFALHLSFNERYLNELGYSRKPLGEFLLGVPREGEFGRAVEKFRLRREIGEHGFLSQEENRFELEYFGMLGKGDSLSQSGYFSAQNKILEEKKAESEREAKARGALYLKLGLLGGLAAVILII